MSKTWEVRGLFSGFHMDDGEADIVNPFSLVVEADTVEQAQHEAKLRLLNDLEFCETRSIQITETWEIK